MSKVVTGSVYFVSFLASSPVWDSRVLLTLYLLIMVILFIPDTFFSLSLFFSFGETRTYPLFSFSVLPSFLPRFSLPHFPTLSGSVLPTNRPSSLGAYLESWRPPPPPPSGDFEAIPCGGTGREGKGKEGGDG